MGPAANLTGSATSARDGPASGVIWPLPRVRTSLVNVLKSFEPTPRKSSSSSQDKPDWYCQPEKVTNGGPDYNSQYGPRYGARDYIAALAKIETAHGPSSYVVPIGFSDFIFDSRDDRRGVHI